MRRLYSLINRLRHCSCCYMSVCLAILLIMPSTVVPVRCLASTSWRRLPWRHQRAWNAGTTLSHSRITRHRLSPLFGLRRRSDGRCFVRPRGGGRSERSASTSWRLPIASRSLLSTLSSSVTTEAATPERTIISYLTDVEGDRDYLHRYVDQSKILHWRSVSTLEAASSTYDFVFPYDECIDFVADDTIHPVLVFGGDVWDQGGNDLFVIRQFLHLQHRYPQSVYFVMGNRDINKMRVTQELGRSRLSEDCPRVTMPHRGTHHDNLPIHHGVFWLRGTGLVGDPLLNQAVSFAEATIQDEAVARLKWMLAYTMGSPRAFAYRKEELKQERELAHQRSAQLNPSISSDNSDEVTDFDVVESYRQSCDPVTGEMSLYLQNAHLLLRLGDVAFVHGALPFTQHNLLSDSAADQSDHRVETSLWDDVTFAMPWLEPNVTAKEMNVTSIDDWIQALNDFARTRVQAWVAAGKDSTQSSEPWSFKGGYQQIAADEPCDATTSSTLAYSQLMQYGMGSTPDGIKNPTVVYNSWGVAGKPRKFFRHDMECEHDRKFVQNTRDFFERTGIRLICSGHQPAGEMPNHIRIHTDDASMAEETSWILCCDTSYSGDTIWLHLPDDYETDKRSNVGRGSAKSGRGPVAVSEVLIEQDTKTGKLLDVHCHGVFSDGTNFASQSLEFGSTMATPDELTVGTVASGESVPSDAQSPHGGKWWTQSALMNGSKLLAAGEGFQIWTRMVTNLGQ